VIYDLVIFDLVDRTITLRIVSHRARSRSKITKSQIEDPTKSRSKIATSQIDDHRSP
jgi:hypothetical protein